MLDLDGKVAKVLYITHQFPCLTETFTYNEVVELRRHGLDVVVVSFKEPDPLANERLPNVGKIVYITGLGGTEAMMGLLYCFLKHPFAFLRLVCKLAIYPYRFNLLIRWLRGWFSLIRGCRVAFRWRNAKPAHIHAQFPMEAATSAMIAAQVLAVPWSFTSHSSCDPPLMREKLKSAAFGISSTHYDKALLRTMYGEIADMKLHVIHGGIYPEIWSRVRTKEVSCPVILSVGTLGEKKGHRFLVESCRRLKDRGYDFRCEIIGDGPLRRELEHQIRNLGLQNIVFLRGALPNPEVQKFFARSTLFCLSCVKARNGDTDGLPFVLMEAMASKLPVVSTQLVGNPELIDNGVHGFLVSPEDAEALADCMAWLLDHPEEAAAMGMQGYMRVCRDFDIRNNVTGLANLIRECSIRDV
jgi:glycosyltransferase involved in cell wall biosynthesis